MWQGRHGGECDLVCGTNQKAEKRGSRHTTDFGFSFFIQSGTLTHDALRIFISHIPFSVKSPWKHPCRYTPRDISWVSPGINLTRTA